MEGLFDLIEYTNRSVFLTGKAGTGKTTFLNDFTKKTHKKCVVAAPTGIAAINAGGVTLHSLFGIPPRTFVPTSEFIDRNYAMNIPDVFHHFKYRKEKKKLLRELELLIIDEVSMMRSDLVDVVDLALKHARRNQLPFGGVQLLLIGDLYQLPPVVKQNSEEILARYYSTPFFFSAKALESLPLITVELTEVYRQQDREFLQILNAIRNADSYDIDFEKLNRRYLPDFEPTNEAYIYLCSHNRMADRINAQKLSELKGETHWFQAYVDGDFKESQYPNEEVLELKVGAQIMFIRNDTSPLKKYYNGKLARITQIDEYGIKALLEDSEEEIVIHRELWEQKKYFVDQNKNIQEEVIGSFEQYPIRLAWAVTIHKSQGLTFDRVIIDAGKSFASGQVYVALSRCRTLEGIVLKSPITPQVVFSDQRIEEFLTNTDIGNSFEEIIENEKYDYAIHKILMNVDVLWLKESAARWSASALGSKHLDVEKAKGLHHVFKTESQKLADVYLKFKKVMLQKLALYGQNQIEWEEIAEKSRGAVNFFYKNIQEEFLIPLVDFYSETKGQKGLKAYNKETKDFIDDLEDYVERLKETHLLGITLFDKSQEKPVSPKKDKKPTHIITYQAFEQGKNPEEIAKERGLTLSTIYGHLGKLAQAGVVDIQRLFDEEKIKTFEEFYRNHDFETLTQWKNVLPDNFDFHEIRILLNHFNSKKEK